MSELHKRKKENRRGQKARAEADSGLIKLGDELRDVFLYARSVADVDPAVAVRVGSGKHVRIKVDALDQITLDHGHVVDVYQAVPVHVSDGDSGLGVLDVRIVIALVNGALGLFGDEAYGFVGDS